MAKSRLKEEEVGGLDEAIFIQVARACAALNDIRDGGSWRIVGTHLKGDDVPKVGILWSKMGKGVSHGIDEGERAAIHNAIPRGVFDS